MGLAHCRAIEAIGREAGLAVARARAAALLLTHNFCEVPEAMCSRRALPVACAWGLLLLLVVRICHASTEACCSLVLPLRSIKRQLAVSTTETGDGGLLGDRE